MDIKIFKKGSIIFYYEKATAPLYQGNTIQSQKSQI